MNGQSRENEDGNQENKSDYQGKRSWYLEKISPGSFRAVYTAGCLFL
jgi:hypothetical protein